MQELVHGQGHQLLLAAVGKVPLADGDGIRYQLARKQRRCPHRHFFTQRGLRWLDE